MENGSRPLSQNGSRPPAENPSRPPRLGYIDWARGIAVLLMIEAHTLDAWTRLASRNTIGFRNATVLGGFAAPLFLWLAGLGVTIAAARTEDRHGRAAAAEAACRRGLEIFLLGFLFRLQALLLTPGGALLTIFRVDILNVMGPSMIAAGLLWAAVRTVGARVAVLSTAAVLVAMATPVVRGSASVGLLPVWLQWYVRPFGEMTTFTLFPWAAFVFGGAAVGVLTAACTPAGSARRMQLWVAAAAAALIAIGFWTASRPTIYAASSFWTSSPTWLAIRVGIVTASVCALYAIEAVAATTSRPVVGGIVAWSGPRLARFGRASLFVYWIHVELVYGYASWLWRHRLPLWGTALAWLAFSALMYDAIAIRDALVARRPPRRQTPATATV
jgi:uncharacterized membrane protein